jgi:hypothetical protein
MREMAKRTELEWALDILAYCRKGDVDRRLAMITRPEIRKWWDMDPDPSILTDITYGSPHS